MCRLITYAFSFINAGKNRNFWHDLRRTEMALQKINVVLNYKYLRTTLYAYIVSMISFLLPAAVIFPYINTATHKSIMFYIMIDVIYHYRWIVVFMLNIQHILSFNVVTEMFGELENAARKRYVDLKTVPCAKYRCLLEIAKNVTKDLQCCKKWEQCYICAVGFCVYFTYIFSFMATTLFTSAILYTKENYLVNSGFTVDSDCTDYFDKVYSNFK